MMQKTMRQGSDIMRTHNRPLARSLFLLLGLAVLGQLPAAAQVQLPEGMTAEQLADIQRRMAAAAQPGEEHALMAALVGEWHQVLKFTPAPGADVMTMEGIATNEMILGGRFLKTESDLHLPGVEGGSLSLLGFDRRSEEFNTIGMDTGGTYWVTAKGKYDEETRTITMSGEDYDAIFGGLQEYDFRIRFVDDDTFVTEIWFKDAVHTRGGPPFMMIEITSTRR